MHLSHRLLPPALLTLLTPRQVLRHAKTGLLATDRAWGAVSRDAGMGGDGSRSSSHRDEMRGWRRREKKLVPFSLWDPVPS